jgi:hypothetical protein
MVLEIVLTVINIALTISMYMMHTNMMDLHRCAFTFYRISSMGHDD